MGLQPTRGALLAPVKTREGEVVAGRAGGSARAASRAGTAAAVVRRAARARRGGASPVPVPVPVPVSAFVGVVAAAAVAAAARPSAVAATAITTAVASTRHSGALFVTQVAAGSGRPGPGALGLLNADDAAVQLCPVDAFHGVLRLDVRAHRHERKAPGVTGPWVAHQVGLDDLAVLGELALDLGLLGANGKAGYVESVAGVDGAGRRRAIARRRARSIARRAPARGRTTARGSGTRRAGAARRATRGSITGKWRAAARGRTAA
jgi:hypothetical protein